MGRVPQDDPEKALNDAERALTDDFEGGAESMAFDSFSDMGVLPDKEDEYAF